VGIAGDYPPFNYLENGQLRGFDVEIARALCSHMQVDCQLIVQPWDSAITALQGAQIDAFISSMSITKERQQLLDFTRPYYNTPVRFVLRQGNDMPVTPAAAWQGKVLAAEDHTIYADYIRAYLVPAGAKLLLVEDDEAVWRAVATKQADAALGDVVANQFVFQRDYGHGLMESGAPLTDTRYMGVGAGIALRKGNSALRDRFDQALLAIHRSGQYTQIRNRYFNFDIWAD
jgi:polar amino acid transport system substrate-binding protein